MTSTMPMESQVAVSATKLLINNQWVESGSGKTFATVNPATGEGRLNSDVPRERYQP